MSKTLFHKMNQFIVRDMQSFIVMNDEIAPIINLSSFCMYIFSFHEDRGILDRTRNNQKKSQNTKKRQKDQQYGTIAKCIL